MKKNNNLYNYVTPKSGNEEINFFNIKGRITRNAFFLRLLFAFGIYILSSLLFNFELHKRFSYRFEILVETIYLYLLPSILILFVLIQGVKRLHDINKSGLFLLIPVYNLYLILGDGSNGNNNYGIDPKPASKVIYFDELNTKNLNLKSQKKAAISKFEIILGILILLIIYLFVIAINKSNISNNKDKSLLDSLKTRSNNIELNKGQNKSNSNNKTTYKVNSYDKEDSNDELRSSYETSDSIVEDKISLNDQIDSSEELPSSIDRYYKVLASASKPVYFYLTPNKSERKESYFTTYEVIHATYFKNDFVYTEFTNSKGQKSNGWLHLSNLILI